VSTSGGANGGILSVREFSFVERATAGVYAATFDVPAGADVVGWQATPVTGPWAADRALFDMEDTLGTFKYAGGVDLALLAQYDPLDGNFSGRINAELSPYQFQIGEPGYAGYNVPITGVDQGAQQFTIAGDWTRYFASGAPFRAQGSTGNDGNYTVASDATFAAGSTTITVNEVIPDPTADGNVNRTGLAAYTTGNAFYLWAQYGNSVRYPNGGTITMTVRTTIAAPPVVPVGELRVRVIFVPAIVASTAAFV